jgi:flavin reductase (DIM6/NTAB) family NADH-FMN oxidoreductase RutF
MVREVGTGTERPRDPVPDLPGNVDPDRFRAVMSRFATGVTIVTSAGSGGPTGLTANAFSSVSLRPPLVLVCLGSGSATHEEIVRSGVFAVNVLDARQRELADRFAVGDRDERFEGVGFDSSATGSPIFPSSLAWLDCRLWARHAAGDHSVLIGEVVDAGGAEEVDDSGDSALIFYRGRYGRTE